MILAHDDIAVTIAGETVYLRPSLRAAMRLERRYGFAQLYRDIQDGKLSTYAAVIGEFTAHPYLETNVWDAGLDALRPKLIAFLLALAGTDDDASDAPKSDGPMIPHREYFTRLYRLGTGWLGWSPEVTWNATPAEITEAYKGRVAMLRAMLGSPEQEAKSAFSLDDKFKAVFGGMARTQRGAGRGN